MLVAKLERNETHNNLEFHRFDHLPDSCLVVIDNDCQQERRIYDCEDAYSEIKKWEQGEVWF